jgi:hypothetical protein
MEKAEELFLSRLHSLQKLHDEWVREQKAGTASKADEQIETAQRNIKARLQKDKDEAEERVGVRLGRLEKDLSEHRRQLSELREKNSGNSSS